MNRTSTLRVEFLRKTEKAAHLEFEGDDGWIPLSQIEELGTVCEARAGDTLEITIPEWLAKKQGWVED